MRIHHVVLFKLADPSEAGALIGDCDARMARIPAVLSYWAGRHLETGRPAVDGDYDAALCLGFTDEAGYSEYVDHPEHRALVARWQPRLEWMRVHDVLDEPP